MPVLGSTQKMQAIIADETARIAALRRYQILDSPAEPAFDEIALLASRICQTPLAFISFIDDRRQWFKSHIGFTLAEMPREKSFCPHTITRSEATVIPDTHEEKSFAANPLVISRPPIRFYAAVPIITRDGFALG